jgi:hypothetical protein
MAEHGTNWSVERNFLEKAQTRTVDGQAKVLKSLRPHYARNFTPSGGEPWQRDDLTVLRVTLRDMSPFDRKTFGELIDVARAVTKAANSMLGRDGGVDMPDIFLNFYRPGASTGEHRDSYTASTVAVGLSGSAELRIQEREEELALPLYATDALRLDNSAPLSERPMHSVVCTGDLPRVAIVNAER